MLNNRNVNRNLDQNLGKLIIWEMYSFSVASSAFSSVVLGSWEGLQGKFNFHGSSYPGNNSEACVKVQCKTWFGSSALSRDKPLFWLLPTHPSDCKYEHPSVMGSTPGSCAPKASALGQTTPLLSSQAYSCGIKFAPTCLKWDCPCEERAANRHHLLFLYLITTSVFWCGKILVQGC